MNYLSYLLLILLLPLIWWLWLRFLRWCDAANTVDWGNRFINRVDGLNRRFCHRYHRLDYEPLQLPESGPAVVIANHISGLDPLLLIAASNRPLRFMIAREQYYGWGLAWFFKAAGCIPVDRQKRPERALRAAMEALEAGEVVAIFPQGGIQKRKGPEKKLKGGAVRLAQKQGCDIYPVLIDGVYAHGHTMLALPFRSRAVLHPLPALSCKGNSYDECMQSLAQILKMPINGVD